MRWCYFGSGTPSGVSLSAGDYNITFLPSVWSATENDMLLYGITGQANSDSEGVWLSSDGGATFVNTWNDRRFRWKLMSAGTAIYSQLTSTTSIATVGTHSSGTQWCCGRRFSLASTTVISSVSLFCNYLRGLETVGIYARIRTGTTVGGGTLMATSSTEYPAAAEEAVMTFS